MSHADALRAARALERLRRQRRDAATLALAQAVRAAAQADARARDADDALACAHADGMARGSAGMTLHPEILVAQRNTQASLARAGRLAVVHREEARESRDQARDRWLGCQRELRVATLLLDRLQADARNARRDAGQRAAMEASLSGRSGGAHDIRR